MSWDDVAINASYPIVRVRQTTFGDRDPEAIRKHAKARPAETHYWQYGPHRDPDVRSGGCGSALKIARLNLMRNET